MKSIGSYYIQVCKANIKLKLLWNEEYSKDVTKAIAEPNSLNLGVFKNRLVQLMYVHKKLIFLQMGYMHFLQNMDVGT